MNKEEFVAKLANHLDSRMTAHAIVPNKVDWGKLYTIITGILNVVGPFLPK